MLIRFTNQFGGIAMDGLKSKLNKLGKKQGNSKIYLQETNTNFPFPGHKMREDQRRVKNYCKTLSTTNMT